MPEIANFLGIRITLNPDDHNPPHFHAEYNEFEAMFDFDGKIIDGKIPTKQARIVRVWAEMRKEQLVKNWYLLAAGKRTFKIKPLK
jgi:hypothetical protein